MCGCAARATSRSTVTTSSRSAACGLVPGPTASKALGARAATRRFGSSHAPLDESLVRCVLDFSNRPHVVWEMAPLRGRINEFDVSVLGEFVRGYAQTAGISMHVDYL